MPRKQTKKAPSALNLSDEAVRDVTDFVEEIRAYEAKAANSMRMSVVVFTVLALAIAGYFKFLVYDYVVVGYTEPETVVPMAEGMINGVLEANELPTLESSRVVEWARDKAKDAAPGLIEEHLRPVVEEQLASLPKRRAEFIRQLDEQAPQAVDDMLETWRGETLPQIRLSLREQIDAQADQILGELDEVIADTIDDVVASQEGNIKDLTDKEVLREAMTLAFEDHLGDYVDEIFVAVDPHLAGAADAMEKVVRKEDKSMREKLELRVIQLMYALYDEYVGQIEEGYEVRPLGTRDLLTGEGNKLLDDVVGETVDRMAGKEPGSI